MNTKFYITLYEELFNVPHNMDDLMDRIVCECSEEQAESLLIPFICDEIRNDYSQSALKYYVGTTSSSILNTLDENAREKFIKNLYRKEKRARK